MKRFHFDKKLSLRLALVIIAGASLLFLSCTKESDYPEIESFEPSIEIAPDFSSISIVSLPPAFTNYLGDAAFEPEEWASFFGVFVLADENSTWSKNNIPIDGMYSIENRQITFTPSNPFLTETNYYIRFNDLDIPGRALANNQVTERVNSGLETRFSIAKDSRPATFVKEVYPTTPSIPRNLLKFYVQLSASMTEGSLLNNVHIIDSEGDTLEHVFLEIPQELWDSEKKRATILFDPGRVKRGLELRDEFGPAFEVGKSYTLLINSNWKDGQQKKLRESYQKKFTIVGDDRTRPDPDKWEVIKPQEGTLTPVTLTFDEPFDYALLNRIITVRNARDQVIRGSTALEKNERQWLFTPDQPWNKEQYYIQIESILEDLAGNNLNTVFDVDLTTVTEKEVRAQPIPFVRIPFKAIVD